jgi:hypothetical protein
MTAVVIDLTAPDPVWRYTESMAYPQRQFNTTLLPDGRMLATNGTSATGCSDPAMSVHAAEMRDPGTERWAVLASNRVTRREASRSARRWKELAPAGVYLLLILNAAGVPSVAKTRRIG